MPNGVAKRDLPHKTCPVCDRPFAWRKKWARDWDSVVYCSDRCRGAAKRQHEPTPNHQNAAKWRDGT